MNETDAKKLENYLERVEAYDGGLAPEVERLVEALQAWPHKDELQPRAGFVNEVAEKLHLLAARRRTLRSWPSRILAGAIGAVALVAFGFMVIGLFARGEDDPPLSALETPIAPVETTVGPSPMTTTLATEGVAPSLPGWQWYEDGEVPGVQFQLPQDWTVMRFRPTRYQAPDTGSIIEVQAIDFAGSDWLNRVNELLPGYALADGVIKENGLVRGRPAFHFVNVGSGSYTMELYVRDEGRIVRFFFQSGTLPRSEEEMSVLATMLETVLFAGGPEGETSLPDGWQEGYTLTVYAPEQLEFTGGLQTITGTVETWEMGPPPNEAALVDSSGARYRIDLGFHYIFEGHPIAYLVGRPVLVDVEPGQSITVKGFHSGETPNGTPRIFPLIVETDGEEAQSLLFYQPLFDLSRASPAALAEYPESATVYVRGPWEQVIPLFASEPQGSAPGGVAGLDADTDVLVKGTLAGTEPPHLNVSELYYLDGACTIIMSGVKQCQYYRRLQRQAANSAANEGRRTITGQIVHGYGDRRPVGGATLQLDPGGEVFALTQKDGRFTLTNVPFAATTVYANHLQFVIPAGEDAHLDLGTIEYPLVHPPVLPLKDYPPADTPYYVEAGDFWLVHNPDGELLAFVPTSPAYREDVPVGACRFTWDDAVRRFVDPCSGDEWELDGTLNLVHSTERWSNRDLDQYAITVGEVTVTVHLDQVVTASARGE
jgi:hypothetical protein